MSKKPLYSIMIYENNDQFLYFRDNEEFFETKKTFSLEILKHDYFFNEFDGLKCKDPVHEINNIKTLNETIKVLENILKNNINET